MVVGLTAALTCVATADAHFVIVAYENRPGITRPCFSRVRRSLYSVTYRAGALAPGSHSADRPAWLERELENDSSSSISSAEALMMGDAHDRLILCNASELMRDGVPPSPCTALSGSRRGGADLLARPRALWRRGTCKAVPECAGGQPAQVRECRHASGKSGGAARPHPVHASRAAAGQAVGGWSTSWRAPISAHGSRSHEPAPEGYRTHHTVRVDTLPRYIRSCSGRWR